MKKKKKNATLQLNNKKAFFSYTILTEYTAGIVLKGHQVKEIKNGNATLTDSYAYFSKQELWLKGLQLPSKDGETHVKKAHKLLLHQQELQKINKAITIKGNTLIPIRLFATEKKGWIKIVIAVAKGKKQFDKRAAIQKKQMERQAAQVSKRAHLI